MAIHRCSPSRWSNRLLGVEKAPVAWRRGPSHFWPARWQAFPGRGSLPIADTRLAWHRPTPCPRPALGLVAAAPTSLRQSPRRAAGASLAILCAVLEESGIAGKLERQLVLPELTLVQPGVDSAPRQQLRVGALLHDPPSVHHQQPVGP